MCLSGPIHWNVQHDFEGGEIRGNMVFTCMYMYNVMNIICTHCIFIKHSGVLVGWVRCAEVCWWPFCNSMLWTSPFGRENQEKGPYMCVYSYSQALSETLPPTFTHPSTPPPPAHPHIYMYILTYVIIVYCDCCFSFSPPPLCGAIPADEKYKCKPSDQVCSLLFVRVVHRNMIFVIGAVFYTE